MSATLYELAGIRETLDALFAEQEGEITPEQEAALDAFTLAFDEKVERVGLYTIEQLSHAKAIKAEEERLAQRRKSYESKADWLKGYLERCLALAGKSKVEGLACSVAMQKNPPSVSPLVPIDDTDLRNIAMYAPTLVRHEESWALDKKAILEAHKAGTLPSDVAKRVAITQSTSLRIR